MGKFYENLSKSILNCLEEGPMTRGQLSIVMDVPRTTLYDHIVKLIKLDKVIRFTKTKKKRKKMGRPEIWFKLI